MRKTLAILLALAFVLALMPAAFATDPQPVTNEASTGSATLTANVQAVVPTYTVNIPASQDIENKENDIGAVAVQTAENVDKLYCTAEGTDLVKSDDTQKTIAMTYQQSVAQGNKTDLEEYVCYDNAQEEGSKKIDAEFYATPDATEWETAAQNAAGTYTATVTFTFSTSPAETALVYTKDNFPTAEGAVYKVGGSSEQQFFPETLSNNDYFFDGTYGYTYVANSNGWTMQPLMLSRDDYQTITELSVPIAASICDKPVVEMGYVFFSCTALTKAPEIPASVTNLEYTFGSCSALTEAPEIPASVTNLENTFNGCTALTKAPEIPASVTNLGYTFCNCKKLTGDIIINTNSNTCTSCTNCFQDAGIEGSGITLKGSDTNFLNNLAATNTYSPTEHIMGGTPCNKVTVAQSN